MLRLHHPLVCPIEPDFSPGFPVEGQTGLVDDHNDDYEIFVLADLPQLFYVHVVAFPIPLQTGQQLLALKKERREIIFLNANRQPLQDWGRSYVRNLDRCQHDDFSLLRLFQRLSPLTGPSAALRTTQSMSLMDRRTKRSNQRKSIGWCQMSDWLMRLCDVGGDEEVKEPSLIDYGLEMVGDEGLNYLR